MQRGYVELRRSPVEEFSLPRRVPQRRVVREFLRQLTVIQVIPSDKVGRTSKAHTSITRLLRPCWIVSVAATAYAATVPSSRLLDDSLLQVRLRLRNFPTQ